MASDAIVADDLWKSFIETRGFFKRKRNIIEALRGAENVLMIIGKVFRSL